MVALMQALREPSDGHRRLALAVELVESWPENVEGALQIGDVHRSAAVIDCAQVRYVGSGDLRRMYEPGQHRRCGEHRHARMPGDHVQNRCDIKMWQHDLVLAFQEKRQRV